MKVVPTSQPGAWLVVKEGDERSDEKEGEDSEEMKTVFFDFFE